MEDRLQRNRKITAATYFIFGVLMGFVSNEVFRDPGVGSVSQLVATVIMIALFRVALSKATEREEQDYANGTSEDGYVSIRVLMGDEEVEIHGDLNAITRNGEEVVAPDDISSLTEELVLVGNVTEHSVGGEELAPQGFKGAEIVIEAVPAELVETEAPALADTPPQPALPPASTEADSWNGKRFMNSSAFGPVLLRDPEYGKVLEHEFNNMSPDSSLLFYGKSYGLGARGTRIEGGTMYSYSDVRKMLDKYRRVNETPSQPV